MDYWRIGWSRFISVGWSHSDWCDNKKVDICTHSCILGSTGFTIHNIDLCKTNEEMSEVIIAMEID